MKWNRHRYRYYEGVSTMNTNLYIHDSDRKALQALKAIPGFTPFLKAFMKVWDEKLFRIQSMATMMRLGPDQLPQYYEMLLPICQKLGIAVPELYLQLDVVPNAYTIGDTKPFVVMTSGLLKSLPAELIPTVLAHECGHIACHHCLYTTMGRMILSDAANFLDALGLGGLTSYPLEVAFAYWMRCSEFSADRAAALYEGSADYIVKMCMCFSGYDKDIPGTANPTAFMAQAEEYLQMKENSLWNRALEFILYSKADHPLNAVRAYECNRWVSDAHFKKLQQYLEASRLLEQRVNAAALTAGDNLERNLPALISGIQEVPMPENSDYYVGKPVEQVRVAMMMLGFTHVTTEKITRKEKPVEERQVMNIRIGGQVGFSICHWFPADAEVVVEYYEKETEEEIAAAHPGQVRVRSSAGDLRGAGYVRVMNQLRENGFENFETVEQKMSKKKFFSFDGQVARISINGQSEFKSGEWFPKDALIRIVYNVYPN